MKLEQLSFCLMIIFLPAAKRTQGLLTQLPHPLPDHKHLDYSDNAITLIDYIEYVPSMRRFTLKNNMLMEFPNFANNTHILWIDLENNAITLVPVELLDILVNVTFLSIKNNRISSFPDPTGALSLSKLNIAKNNLTVFPSFPNLGRSLRLLYVSFNRISSIPRRKMRYLRQIETLVSNYNTLSGSVPDIRIMKTITWAGFSGNHLSEFDAQIVDGFQRPLTLLLRQNQITHVTGIFHLNNQTLQRQVTVSLSENPIVCDCKSKWLKQAQLVGSPVIIDAICKSPENYKGMDLADIGITNLTCGDNSRTFGGTLLSSPDLIPLYSITSSYNVRSLTRCLEVCNDQGDCLLFGYRITTSECALTSTSDIDAKRLLPLDGNDIKWYIID